MKGQMGDYIAIVVLIVGLTAFTFFSRLSQGNALAGDIQSLSRESRQDQLWNGAHTVLISTVDGIMMMELLGHYACYEQSIVSFRPGRNINIPVEIIPAMDAYYGDGRWGMELETRTGSACFRSSGINQGICNLKGLTHEFFYPLPCDTKIGRGIIYVQ